MKFDTSKRNALLLAGVAAGAFGLSKQAKADQNFTSFPFLATGGNTTRTDPDRWGETINVKEMGAVGNGSTDDTVAIQAALDLKQSSGKTLYFPPLVYKVTCPAATTITNVVTHTVTTPSGDEEWCLCTVASTTGFATGDMAYVRGVVGVGNANFSYGIDVISAGSPGTILLRNARFSGSYVSGGTLARPCLYLKQAGGLIHGDGAVIRNTTSPNCAVLSINGFQSGVIRDMSFDGGDVAGTIGLDYNWCQRVGDALSSQSCLFENLGCYGADYGLAIGMGQAMCSETLILKPFLSGRTGMIVANQNALSQTIIGGNISGCKDYGIYVSGGACPVIEDIGFQAYFNAVLAGFGYIVGTTLTITSMTTVRHPGIGFEVGDPIFSETAGITAGTQITAILTGTGGVGTYSVNNSQTFASSGAQKVIGTPGKADIYVPAGANDCYSIKGNRSESFNFAWLPYLQPYNITANAHFSGDRPECFFLKGAGEFKLSANRSGCYINPVSGTLEVDSSNEFLLADYWRGTEGSNPNNPVFLSITPPPVVPDATTARSASGTDNNCIIQFTSSSAVTYTLLKTDGTTLRMKTGSRIRLIRYGTGSLTIAAASGVTVHAPTAGAITARAQYSEVWVEVVDAASNLWLVGGDITP